MPQAVSRKQWRLMQAIMHGKADDSKSSGRGTPPKSVAAKYTDPGKDAPEQNGSNRGGSWTEAHHKRAKDKVKAAREERKATKKSKKHLKKSFEDHYEGHAAAALVMNDMNQILLGRHSKGGMAFAGGHMDLTDGSKDITALRELKEELGIVGRNPNKIWSGKLNGNECDVFLIESYTGEPKSSPELKDPRWFDAEDIPWNDIRDCCLPPLEQFVREKLGKSLQGMMALENLQKNNVVKENSVDITREDSTRLMSNGLFRHLRTAVEHMTVEDFKDITLDTYKISIRKHINDLFSGRVNDGHKTIFQFTNKSMHEMTASLMSLFEWYLPEDEAFLDQLDDSLSDDVIHGGVSHLLDNYKRHNIGEIYQEMETIREQMRNGMAVDLQQVEARIMKLFDKLEETIHTVAGKHNELSSLAGNEIDDLERKLRGLQSKIDEMSRKPETVTAYSSHKPNAAQIHDENYPYLPRPQIEISPNGKIKITFGSDWTDIEKSNFLQDMKVQAIKREKRHG